jgi:glycosyltransferase involved in cell wall biosynthesis
LKVSIIIPAYNEQGSIVPLIRAIEDEMTEFDFEMVIVNDGSSDHTYALIKELNNKRITLISLRQNYGQSAAIIAGFQQCEGDIIVLVDADLQNNPKDIIGLITCLNKEDIDLVQGHRRQRQDSLAKVLPSKMANLLIRLLFRVNIHDVGCSLKAFRKNLVGEFLYFNGFHRFIPLIVFLKGFRVKELEVRHQSRTSGYSKYGLSRLIIVSWHLLLLKFSPAIIKEDIKFSISSIDRFK